MRKHPAIDSKLRGLEPFRNCTDRELRKLDRLRTAVSVPANRVLAREGRPEQEFLVIAAGTAVATGDDGAVRRLGRGDHVGGTGILRGTGHEATVVACTLLQLEVMSVPEFRGAYATVPSFRAYVDHELAERERRAAEQRVTRATDVRERDRVLVGYTLAS
jgi:signal-transduction protein with cAMP-binding, CBS, and nucleotidyltransferase domain